MDNDTYIKQVHDGPLVSIITPAYKAEKTISKTIESVINQTYENWEYIIIEDVSPDNTLEIVKKYAKEDKRIFVDVVGEENSKRPAVPRNVAISRSKGKYLAFVDADDQWLPEKLAIQVKFLENNPDYIGVCATANILTPDGNSKILDYGSDKDIFVEDLFNENVIITSSTIIRRESIEKTGGFPEDMKFRGFEDYALWLKVTTLGKIKLLNSPLIKYLDDVNNSVRGRVKTSSWVAFRDIFLEYLFWLLKNKKYSKVPHAFIKLMKLQVRVFYLKLKKDL